MYDVIILGGGPAGLTAAIYCARAGMNALILEGGYTGGQAVYAVKLENYPGAVDGESGPELMKRFEQQAVALGARLIAAQVERVEISDVKRVYTTDAVYEAPALIIATGAEPAKLGIPGELENIGRGVSYCATCDGAFYKNKEVAVVGGGYTAVEDVLFLTNLNCKVYLIHRREQLRARGPRAESALAHPNVIPVFSTTVVRIDKSSDGLRLSLSGDRSPISVSGLFIAAGTRPRADLFNGSLDIDASGYILAGEDTATSVPGVFAAGDVRRKPLRQIVTATSDGAVAAYMASEWLMHRRVQREIQAIRV